MVQGISYISPISARFFTFRMMRYLPYRFPTKHMRLFLFAFAGGMGVLFSFLFGAGFGKFEEFHKGWWVKKKTEKRPP